MNLFFGVVSQGNKNFDKVQTKIDTLYNINSSHYANTDGNICCGYNSNGGSIVGKAENDGIFFIYIGSLYKPMPGWTNGSPMDTPDETALFLLRRYKKKGKSFMDNVLGSYAFFLFDAEKDLSMIGSDPDGFRKLYYRYENEGLYFSTTLLSTPFLIDKKTEINRSMEDFLLGYEFLPGTKTIYKDIFSLKPGKTISLKKNKISEFCIKKFKPKIEKKASENDLIDSLYKSFLNAIEDQCPSTEKVAVLLGGFDSALVASILKKMGKKVETFTFCFEKSQYNQKNTDYLKTFYGIEHTWVKIDQAVILNGLSKYALYFNQVTSSPHYIIQTAEACRIMRNKGYRNCLTGHGCDEIFLGYPNVHNRAKFFLNISKTPKSLIKFLYTIVSNSILEKYFGHPIRFIRNFLNIAKRDMPVRGHISNRIFDDFSLKRMRLETGPNQSIDSETLLESLAIGLEELSPLRLAYHGKAMPGLSKTNIEGSANISGLNIVSPYFHPSLTNFSTVIPEELLRPTKKTKSAITGKYILMKMVEKYNLLPNEIIYQKKASPVASPVDSWYSGALESFILESIKELPFEYDRKYVERLLKPKFTEKLFRDHISIGSYTSNAIAVLVTYASFAKYLKQNH